MQTATINRGHASTLLLDCFSVTFYFMELILDFVVRIFHNFKKHFRLLEPLYMSYQVFSCDI